MKNLFRPGLILLAFISTLNTSAQAPMLSSLPSASAVIFLDFNGYSFDNTAWNYSGPIYCGASGLTNAQITTIFNLVSEDYRPFNVNITTDSTKYLAAPLNQRMRVVLTVTSAWYGAAGGVSFVGSFTWGDDTPCFVFTALLGLANTKYIAEAAAHEAGHTLGLYHQSTYDVNCVKLSDYNYGQGSGEIGWAPIMGVGYYENFTLWNNGPNSNSCTIFQSDLDVITTNNGFTYRTDDYPNTFAAATNLPFITNQFSVSGVIERSTDMDMFKFTQPAPGRFQLNAIPYNVGSGDVGSDLDMQVTLYNSSQTQLAMYNPGTLLSSFIDTTLNPGVYYLKIEGRGNIYAPAYASLGSYSLTGFFTANNPLPLRVLELHGELVGGKHHLSWIIDADEQVTKQVLEISTDGRNFSPVTQSPVEARSFTYKPYVSTTAQYRLNVTFDNGHQYYSNIVTLRQTDATPRPQLIGTLITTNSITVTSPGTYEYSIYDFNGKTVGNGQLTNGLNTISASGMTPGMYIISFVNGTEQWRDKFVRQ